jgi:redox-sensing transcriptional repressor
MSQQRNEDTFDGVAKRDTFDGVGKRDTLDGVGKRDTFRGVGKRDTFNGVGKRDSAGRTGRDADVPDFPDLPEATVARLPEYLRALHHLAEAGHETVSSEGLAGAAGVNSAKLRKDLSHLGSYGTRGVGYDVEVLVGQIESVLGLTQRRAVALVGVGNLGHALAGYGGFASRGFRIAALVDADPSRVGENINGLMVRHIDDLDSVVTEQNINIAVIATPVHAAQIVADRLVAAGVTSILNFAPCVLAVPEGVDVRKVDLAIELQILSFHEHRKASNGAGLSARARREEAVPR